MAPDISQLIIHVKVIASAGRNEILIEDDHHIKVKLTTAPEKGKANKKLIELLARELKISKNNITIINGEYNRNKIISIDHLSQPLTDLLIERG